MTITSWYRQALLQAIGSGSAGNAPNFDFLSDVIKISLHTSSYTPDLDAHVFRSSLTNEVANGNGYTTGGATLGMKAASYVPAASAIARANSTAYTLGQLRRPASSNGYVYQVVVAGTSGGSEPTWPTVIGTTVTDGGVTWLCVGRGYIMFDAADPSWANATITARYAVIYDDTPATDAAKPLLWLIDFESNVSSTNGTYQITFDANGIGYIAV